MADKNDGRGRVARHGMKVIIGTDTYLGLTRQVDYEYTWAIRERLTDLSYNQGVPDDATKQGDYRKGRLRLTFRYGMNHSAADSIIALFGGTNSDVQKVADITTQHTDSQGATTGEALAFSNCELAGDPVQRPGSGTEGDTITYEFEHDSEGPAGSDLPGS